MQESNSQLDLHPPVTLISKLFDANAMGSSLRVTSQSRRELNGSEYEQCTFKLKSKGSLAGVDKTALKKLMTNSLQVKAKNSALYKDFTKLSKKQKIPRIIRPELQLKPTSNTLLISNMTSAPPDKLSI